MHFFKFSSKDKLSTCYGRKETQAGWAKRLERKCIYSIIWFCGVKLSQELISNWVNTTFLHQGFGTLLFNIESTNLYIETYRKKAFLTSVAILMSSYLIFCKFFVCFVTIVGVDMVVVKGTVSQDFLLQVFIHEINFPHTPENNIRVI